MRDDFYTKKRAIPLSNMILMIASVLCIIATIIVFIFYNRHQKSKYNSPEAGNGITSSATNTPAQPSATPEVVLDPIIPTEMTIGTRFNPPAGYTRVAVANDSFGSYLRTFALREYKTLPLVYDSATKTLINNTEAPAVSVLAMDLINKSNLQEASNSAVRLYAEFLYSKGRFDDISFNLLTTPAFKCDFRTWTEGGRLAEEGNTITWCKEHGEHCNHRDVDTGTEYNVFRYYLQNVMIHSNLDSLKTNLSSVSSSEVTVGDVIIYADSRIPDIVVDVATDANGNKLVLLARGGSPASEIYIVRNESNADMNPWHELNKLLAGASFYRFK